MCEGSDGCVREQPHSQALPQLPIAYSIPNRTASDGKLGEGLRIEQGYGWPGLVSYDQHGVSTHWDRGGRETWAVPARLHSRYQCLVTLETTHPPELQRYPQQHTAACSKGRYKTVMVVYLSEAKMELEVSCNSF